jgi:hypothetical protein
MLAAMMIATFALAATGCSTANNAAAERAVQEMNQHGGPN